ncbi:MAG: ABC transporter permease [Methanocella sp.]
MRFFALFKKTAVENLRDWKILSMTLLFAPIFVILMYFYITAAPQTYVVLIDNKDVGAMVDSNMTFNAGDDLIALMKNASYPDGTKVIQVREEGDLARAKVSLIDRTADLVVEIPEDFSGTLAGFREDGNQSPATVRTTGDPSNPKYILAASYSDMITYTYAAEATGARVPVALDITTVSNSEGTKTASTFDGMVPGLLALSLMMLMFTAAASIIREKDKGTIIRLKMSKMRASDYLASVSLGQILIGIGAMGLTFLTAIAVGYRPGGPLLEVLLVCVLCSLSIIGISLIMAAFLRSIFDLMTIGCFPFFILMFFSGGMFPLPALHVFTLFGHAINVNDVLPTTHAIFAIDRILNYGTGLAGLQFEIGALAVLTVAYFVIGLWLFKKKYLDTV